MTFSWTTASVSAVDIDTPASFVKLDRLRHRRPPSIPPQTYLRLIYFTLFTNAVFSYI